MNPRPPSLRAHEAIQAHDNYQITQMTNDKYPPVPRHCGLDPQSQNR